MLVGVQLLLPVGRGVAHLDLPGGTDLSYRFPWRVAPLGDAWTDSSCEGDVEPTALSLDGGRPEHYALPAGHRLRYE
ncbi:hypothetical protein D3C78_1488780 [compost metagenome]